MDTYHRFDEEPTNHQQSSLLDQETSETPSIPSRNLQSIRPGDPSAAPQDEPQRAPSAHNISMRPTPPPSATPPQRRPSGLIEVEDLLNSSAEDAISADGRQHDGEGTDSLWTAPMAAMSRPAKPSLPPRDIITLPPIAFAPHPSSRSNAWQSPSVLPRDQASTLMGSGPLPPSKIVAASSMLCAAPDRPGNLAALANPALRSFSPTTHYHHKSSASTFPQVASTGEPPFFFSAFDASEAWGQNQCEMTTLGTEQGLIQVPVDVQAGSQAAGEKRKRNATASRAFRQRQKGKDWKIANLEALLRKTVKEKDHYREERNYYLQERDYFLRTAHSLSNTHCTTVAIAKG